MAPRERQQRQQQQGQGNQGGNEPVATIFAIVPREHRSNDNRPREKWVKIGSLWRALETSNLVGEVDAIPFPWLSGAHDARVCIVMRDNEFGGQSR